MSNIIEFPTKSVRDWISIENTVRSLLNQSNASDKLTEVVVDRMKGALEEHQFEYSLSLNVKEEPVEKVNHKIADFAKALQDHSNNLLLSRLFLEVRLAQAEGHS
ncbi:hypothetical protein [Neptunicella sp.]|uniref:hypothetical protein n=1 Tax=Neptunicella sp. TaxID=2125986 RepID=UPI003F69438A